MLLSAALSLSLSRSLSLSLSPVALALALAPAVWLLRGVSQFFPPMTPEPARHRCQWHFQAGGELPKTKAPRHHTEWARNLGALVDYEKAARYTSPPLQEHIEAFKTDLPKDQTQ